MKNICKIVFTFCLVCSVCLMSSCGKNTDTIANSLAETFKQEMASTNSMEDVAQALASSDTLEIAVDAFEIKEGDYMPGFTTEIKGFKKAFAMNPMVGSIPFVSYIFEVDNPEEFEKTLLASADPRWNVCTEADDTVTAIEGNYVYFVMAPSSFE